MSSIDVDVSAKPVVVVTFTGKAADPEFKAYLDRMSEIVTAFDPLAFLFDARASLTTAPAQLSEQARWMVRHQQLLRKVAGTVFVIDQPALRFALSSVFAVAPMYTPHAVFEDLEQAGHWLRERLLNKGVTLSAEAAQRLRELSLRSVG